MALVLVKERDAAHNIEVIAIKNADGTLVPVIDTVSGASRTVALSLVHSHQKRAEILLYELQDGAEHIRDLPQPEPFGKLVLRRLPDNPFGEVEIQAELSIDDDMRLHVSAEAGQEKAVKGNFRIPSAGLGQAERMDQMTGSEEAPDTAKMPESDVVEDTAESAAGLEFQDDLFDQTFDDSFFGETETKESDFVPETESLADLESTTGIDFEPDSDSETPMAPIASQIVPQDDVFINDPEDEDWGFDELADPTVVDEEYVHPVLPEPEPAMPDISAAKETKTNDFLAGTELEPDFGPDIKLDAGADFESDPELAEDQEPVPVSSRGQRLLLASAVLFSLSLVELGVYFLLRMHIV